MPKAKTVVSWRLFKPSNRPMKRGLHDYGVKMKAVRRFFEEGDKVKVTLRFRGREMAHQDLGFRLLERVKSETLSIAKVEAEPSMEGRQMIMVLAPK
jgi:translation initiation factor IF-3